MAVKLDYPPKVDNLELHQWMYNLYLKNIHIKIINILDCGALGDGVTDDSIAIASAIAAILTGGILYAPLGTYYVGSTGIIIGKQLKFIGDGEGTIITGDNNIDLITVNNSADGVYIADMRLNGRATDESNNHRGILVTGSAVNTRIKRIRFSGINATSGFTIQAQLNSGTSQSEITHCHFERVIGTNSNYGYGILANTTNDNLIAHNKSYQSATQGRHHIYLSAGSSYNRVLGNVCDLGTQTQIELYAIDTQSACQYNIVDRNTLTNCGSTVSNTGAVHIAVNASFNKISNNMIVNSNMCGISLEASSISGESHADDNEVKDNWVGNSKEFGILVLGASRSLIQGNTVYENGQTSAGTLSGIDIRSNGVNAIADANRVKGNDGYGTTYQRAGLSVQSGSYPATNTIISGNVFPKNNTYSVEIGGTNSIVKNDNTFGDTPDNSDSALKAFTDGDTSPDISGGHEVFITANTNPTTIIRFDEAYVGQKILVIIGDANTTFDFTATFLKGNAGVDWSPTTNDHLTATYDGTYWHCDISKNVV